MACCAKLAGNTETHGVYACFAGTAYDYTYSACSRPCADVQAVAVGGSGANWNQGWIGKGKHFSTC